MKQSARAQLRYARISPRKTRLLLDMIRGMRVTEALAQLKFSNKSVSGPLLKLIQSAVANAKNTFAADENSLVIIEAFADAGPMQYRFVPRAFGRASPIRKRTAHVTIVVEGEAGEQKSKKSDENAPEEISVKQGKKTVAKKKTVSKNK